MQLESLEDKLPGIYRVEASYLHETMKVEFDEAIVNENDIAEAASQMGYCLIIKSANN